ncbi:hypothetical protein A5892_17845 [Halotalea alkalilenta]|uniref:Cell division ATP-binding protein FtsE n=1 Tax=Halotalea alkalilenta TaxID=376489 RepID=A0A172YKP7_9GAMM|nr:hypothetical protein A5892_17845 [Halotalea alkalilenta]
MEPHVDDAAGRQAPRAGDAHIVFRSLSKHYHTARGPVEALKGIDLKIRRAEIFGIIGRSGAGKSSLIRTINRLERASGGSVEIDGQDVQRLSGNELVRLRRRTGMIFQHFNLLRSKSVFENLALPARAAGLPRAEIRRRVERLLALVGLEGKAEVFPSRLSGGQKQRVGIARALMLDPEVLLCDEATSALDPETTQTILALLREINRRLGLTIVLITHEMAVIREVCDRVAVLEHGELVESGPVWQVFGAPRHDATKAMLAPLAVRLPEDLAARLREAPQEGHDTLVFKLDYGGVKGRQDGVGLGRILAALGDRAMLLHGGIDRLQGHAQGSLLVGIKGGDARTALEQAALIDARIEVVGYV